MRTLPIVLVLVVACTSGGPSPSPSAAPATAPSADTPATGAPAAGATANAASSANNAGVVDVGAFKFAIPDGWTKRDSNSPMRRAHLAVPGKAGNGYLVVYYFGKEGAGGVRENIDRWVGQFRAKDGTPAKLTERKDSTVGDMKVTQIEVAGDYAGSMVGKQAVKDGKPDQRLIATIVESKIGPYYFKLLGPDATIADARKAHDGLIASIK